MSRLTKSGDIQHTSHTIPSTKRKLMRDEIRRKYNNICQNCQVLTDINDYEGEGRLGGNFPTLDHVVPACLGGKFELDNLTLLCNDCNWNMGRLLKYYNVDVMTLKSG